ncbi:bifunctional 5,10-methylenetetrahydrofolate dehydrogenase/5,10-methenyltetrahydrofolate cyclohydrolase [Mycoplasma procyoni]|uniref:bifunctional 5,10-methylenetetrahydrofolate dehydrogenase/5,10-methenyltetrahydrofolate cyclohydrolase n=1 Tax=Mycoplasma procyoni TaxID=568784 RepID=UPI00197B9C96|nr:bifunctional 5,10-methylenetetrahydrofolate dehydrogenase/5,10-methenyltetrahydrofolate cyclohydrolase [Mycoplasma procyoni]MBN3535057.1 bifunctional 5,10-methylenetetrahydrofolate dehydrogenase/5,10-methenyltetrahydrofolate cyclohydrolase [Mycoplasma procyoni]
MQNNFILIDGKKVSAFIFEKLKTFFESLDKKALFKIIQVGDNPASNKYIANKLKKASELSIESKHIKLNQNITQSELENIVKQESKECDGIIVQLPLPEHIDSQKVLDCVILEKDLDGLSQKNQQAFYLNQDAFAPATALGVIELLKFYNVPIKDKKAYVIGESNLVGKPTKFLLKQQGAITKSFNKHTGIKGSEEADILVVAAGHKHLVKPENIKQGAVVIDVGINTLSNAKITGDVDFEAVKHKASAISPVPGGVGPMTIISLFLNLKKAIEQNRQKSKSEY